MNPLQPMLRRLLFLSVGLLVILLIIWLLTPYKPFIAGIALGLVTGLYNVLYTARKVRLSTERYIATGGKKAQGTGMINRFLMVTLAVIIAALRPTIFDMRTIALGLPICYILTVLLEFWQVRRESLPTKRG